MFFRKTDAILRKEPEIVSTFKETKKMTFKKLSLMLSAALLAAGCTATQVKSPVKESKTAFAAAALKPFADSGALPGAISILCKGNLQETTCVGYADPAQKRPIALNSTYMQCSQTKGFCGVTIAILVEE